MRHRIIVEDILDDRKAKISIEKGYGGILFESHFCLSKRDAKKLAKWILAATKGTDLRRKPNNERNGE